MDLVNMEDIYSIDDNAPHWPPIHTQPTRMSQKNIAERYCGNDFYNINFVPKVVEVVIGGNVIVIIIVRILMATRVVKIRYAHGTPVFNH